MNRRELLLGSAAALAASNAEAFTPMEVVTRLGTVNNGLYNFSSASLPNLYAAHKNGTKATILCTGDSTTYGSGTTQLSQTYPYQFYQTLLAGGWPVAFDAICGWNLTDSRVVLTGGVTPPLSLVGCCTGYQFSSAGSLAYTPGVSVDTFDIYIDKGAAAGIATVNIDGGATLATLSTNGAAGVQKITVSAALGAHALNIVWVSGTVYLQAVDAYNSAGNKIRIINGGKPNQDSSAFNNTNVFSPAFVAAMQPTATILNDGINDWTNGVALNTYQTNLQQFIDACKAVGDVLLIGPNSTGGTATEATQLGYIDRLKSMLSANSIAMVDLRQRLGTYAAANASGLMFDTLHPNAAGYAIIGGFIGGAVLNHAS